MAYLLCQRQSGGNGRSLGS
nr:hypothetical protein [Neisseria meningitidis]